MTDIGALGVVLGVAGLIGWGLWRGFGIPGIRFGETVFFSIGLGLGVLAYGTFGLAVLGCLGRWSVVAFASAAGVLAAAIVARPSATAAVSNTVEDAGPRRAWVGGLWLLVGVAVVCNALSALAPPLGMDALSYHLALPRAFVDAGRLVYVPVYFWGYPGTIEMLYTMALLVRGDALAGLIHMAFGALTAGSAWVCGHRWLSPQAGVLAAAIVYLTPMVISLSVQADTDLGLAYFGAQAFCALLLWLRGGHRRLLWVAAIFTGLGMGSKYLGLFGCAALVAVIIGARVRARAPAAHTLGCVVRFVAVAVAVALPWHVKNWVVTGNPVWPFLFQVFDSRDVIASAWAASHRLWQPGLVGFTMWELACFPWNLVMFPQRFDTWFYSPGPLALAFLPVLVGLGWRHAVIRLLVGYGAVILLLVFLSAQAARFAILAVWPIGLATAWGVLGCLTGTRLVRAVTGAAVAATLLLGVALSVAHVVRRWPVVVGWESRETYLTRRDDTYMVLRSLDRLARAPSGRVLLLDPRLYYGGPAVTQGIPWLQGWLDYAQFDSSRSLASFLRAQDFSYVVVSHPYLAQYREKFTPELEAFFRLWARPEAAGFEALFEHHGVVLYRVPQERASTSPPSRVGTGVPPTVRAAGGSV